MKNIKSNKLKKRDVIWIISPSWIFSTNLEKQLKTGINVLKKYWFKIKFSKNALKENITVEEKVADIHQMFSDKQVKAIITTQGGQNSNSVLDFLDFELIKNNPKIFMWISDITVLLNAIYKKTGLITFHWNNILFGFWREYSKYSQEEFIERLVEWKIGKINQNSEYICVREWKAEWILVGWNLWCINKLAWTKYFPDFKDKIIFLEDFEISTPPEKVKCFLYQLKQNWVFEKIKWIWVGNYNHPSWKKYEDIVLEVTKEFDFPILKSSDFWHNTENTTIPIWVKVKLDATNKNIEILENCVI